MIFRFQDKTGFWKMYFSVLGLGGVIISGIIGILILLDTLGVIQK